jgi:hypothetical protein
VVEFGEWLCEEVIKAVPHCHLIFSLPKMLRRYFLYDRKLLAELSRCAWETFKVFLKEIDPGEGVVPGAVIAIQSFGDFLEYNPHAYILLTDGCFHDNGMFRVALHFDPKTLEEIFRHKVFRLLIAKGKITADMVKLRKSWRQESGPGRNDSQDHGRRRVKQGIPEKLGAFDSKNIRGGSAHLSWMSGNNVGHHVHRG